MQNFLDYAANLARKIDPHKVAPNPRVGCVVVKKGKILAEGVHEIFGKNHAEKNAIAKIKKQAGCEVYITLEPCDYFEDKKTPSCTELLIFLNPKKVVVGGLDPQFNGKNLEKLRLAGIAVEVLENENCKNLNPFFGNWITKKRPFICLKIAQSLDGKITQEKEKYLTNDISRKKVHRMRAKYSAILTTTETILKDDPRLDCRLDAFECEYPVSSPRIIVLGKRKIQKTAKIFSIPNREIYFLESLDDLMEFCRTQNIDSILTECGAQMNALLLEKSLVDEIQVFIAPKILGKTEKSSFFIPFGQENSGITHYLEKFEDKAIKNLEGDLWIRYAQK